MVATAAIRGAANRDELSRRWRPRGLGVEIVLDGEEEARLAFLGATRTLGATLPGSVAVVDVGGGSTEIAVGTLAAGVTWCALLRRRLESARRRRCRADPPSPDDLGACARRRRARSPARSADADVAIAVGGSATSLRPSSAPRSTPRRSTARSRC